MNKRQKEEQIFEQVQLSENVCRAACSAAAYRHLHGIPISRFASSGTV
jgi:hypothetical protein